MNICMVVWKFHPCPEGGAERQCRKLAAELSRQGHRCEVLTSRLRTDLPPEEVMPEGYSVRRLGKFAWLEEWCKNRLLGWRKRLPRPLAEVADFWLPLPFVRLARLSFMRGLRQFFQENFQQIDIVHVHEAHWIAGTVMWACQGLALPVVCKEATFPAVAQISYDAPLRAELARLRRQAEFIALTEPVAASLRESGIPADQISLISNGVVLPAERSPIAGSREVVYVGNLTQGVRWKAFDILFAAWALLQRQDQGRAWRLVVLGAGDPAPWRQQLAQHGCLDSVHFAGSVKDVGEYLRKACLFVLPSRVEGLSNALLEAMSWGLPVLVSNIPANLAVIQHQVNGWTVPVNDSMALAEAMLALLQDEELSLRLGRAARQTVETQYTIERVTGQLVALYQNLLAKKRVHAA